MNWILITERNPMPEGSYYQTKIDDGKGERNFELLKRQGNLYFTTDGTYIYYTPTHFLN